jgi:hypothetical protein
MNAVFTVKCPYCGFLNKRTTDRNYEPVQLIYCQVEEGGCDNQFAYQPDITVTVDVKVFKLSPLENAQ